MFGRGLFYGLGTLLIASTATAWHRLPKGAEAWSALSEDAIRGVTVGPIESSLQPGRGYGTGYSEALLDELARMGVNWISVTPFGRLWSLEDTHIRMDFEAPYDDNRAAVRTMIHQAHARGMRVLLVPHLWIETEGWRGEIEPGTPEGWAAYQTSYRDFVFSWARDAAAAGADAFSIGVECRSWSGRFGPFWHRLIDEVRDIFPGLLTYSANWDEAQDVLFWDRLDLLGINAFYPLADEPHASFETYYAGAVRVREEHVRPLVETFDMPILFVEVGYTARAGAAVRPWEWPDQMALEGANEEEQARALAAVFQAFASEPWFAGLFIWRYYANIDDVSQEAIWGFSPHAKEAEPFIDWAFGQPWRADGSPWPWRAPLRLGLPQPGAFPYASILPVP